MTRHAGHGNARVACYQFSLAGVFVKCRNDAQRNSQIQTLLQGSITCVALRYAFSVCAKLQPPDGSGNILAGESAIGDASRKVEFWRCECSVGRERQHMTIPGGM